MLDIVIAAVFVAAVILVMVLVRLREGKRIGPSFELWRPSTKEGTRERVREGMVALVIGAAVMGAGAFAWGLPLTCDGDAMRPGDYCQTYTSGGERVGEPQSYSSKLGSQQQIGLLIGGLGVLIAAQGMWWVVRDQALRRRLARQP